MLFRKLLKPENCPSLAIVDSLFPQKEPFAFRNVEINEYLSRISLAQSYTMPVTAPDKDAWFTHTYGVDRSIFNENCEGYLSYYPYNKQRLNYLDNKHRYSFGLAYSFFLGETYTLLPFYEKNKIPFTFVLYPGGCFGMNHAGSDKMLKKIFSSKQFRQVIVTQKIVYDYLIDNNLCDKTQVTYIYGGFVQFKKEDVKTKQKYKTDKRTFDICFVAAKYSDKGVDKGYDSFIAVAKKLSKKNDDIRFHVVGGFDQNDIDITDIKDKITFYGYKKPDYLVDFYPKMDIFLAQNRNGILYDGSFDGFPLGIDAGYCGVALFVGDPLHMNNQYKENEDIVIVDNDIEATVKKIFYYYQNLGKLYKLAEKGAHRTQVLFDIDHQIDQRIKVFQRFTTL
jgi:glycosyltransferase involved in cell wall biosynthesis